ncbi:MAG: (2Fe-2S)-binding protein [Bryobacterales bacterium]|nr:(2Fe-2S)-binding protein [Bryobacterales bacterium]
MAEVVLNVNGGDNAVEVDPDSPLLYVLMDAYGLKGPKFGCGLAQCGACTVLMDGEPYRSCTLPVSEAKGKIVTLEGLGTMENPHPIQKAFIDEQALQCGFCISGPVLYGKAFIDKNPGASEAQIQEALGGLLCRCYAHPRMLKALVRYAKEVKA